MKNIRTWAFHQENESGVLKGALDKESGPQNASPAFPSTSYVALEKTLHLSGFHQVVGQRILRELSLPIAKDSKVPYFGFFNIILTSNSRGKQIASFTLLSGRK